MANGTTYSVIVSGRLKDGVDPSNIQTTLANLLKVPPEKAAELMRRQWVIKKNVDQQTAAKYKNKLESIGLIIGLKEHSPAPPAGSELTLALEPTDNKPETGSATPSATTGTASCPKCGTEQVAESEQCTNCGVYLHKVMAQAGDSAAKSTDTQQAQSQAESADTEDETTTASQEEILSNRSIGVGAAAALLGAIIWNVIGNVTGYELGIVAWGIGGAVGYAVAVTGGCGNKAGIACAVLALVAIVGGKYMLYSSFKDDVGQLVSENTEEIRLLYDAQWQMADAYASVSDDESLRDFMVEYEFTSSTSSDGVTESEITEFRTDVEPGLIEFASKNPEFEEWVGDTLETAFGEYSTMDLMAENFGFLDVVFLFLGIGTAFRLGYGMQ